MGEIGRGPSSTSLTGFRMLVSASRFSRTFNHYLLEALGVETEVSQAPHGTEKLLSEADDIRLNVIVTSPGDDLCRPYWARSVVVAEVRLNNGPCTVRCRCWAGGQPRHSATLGCPIPCHT